jgi:hypothetical protein
MKSALEGIHFPSVDEVKSKMAGLLNRVTADNLQHCFKQRKIRMLRCIDVRYFKINILQINIFILKYLTN